VETAGNRKARGDLNRDPMPKVHTEFGKKGSEEYVPLRKVINKKRAAGL
jgi:hypothetical protein